ncbi:MAG: Tat pathway signal protein [Paracoccaceae bacterium]|nr:Tat pathway signal protein [Paracoccaceae bacterium]
MPNLSRRGFLAATLAAGSLRGVPRIALREKRVLTLVYDKALGAMRAIDRVVP